MTDEDKVKQAFEDTIWMAIRYASGRQTYAPHMVRSAIKLFQEVYPDWKPRVDRTVKDDAERFKGKYDYTGEVDSDWLDDLVEEEE